MKLKSNGSTNHLLKFFVEGWTVIRGNPISVVPIRYFKVYGFILNGAQLYRTDPNFKILCAKFFSEGPLNQGPELIFLHTYAHNA